MFNIASILVGLVALLLAIFAFFPLLGWAYWFIVPVAVVGLALGLLSRSGNGGRNLNLLVIVVGVVRLMLGGGIF